MLRLCGSLLALAMAGCSSVPPDAAANSEQYDLIVRNGVVYDGSGAAPQRVDVAVRGDRVVALLPAGTAAEATRIVDARGQAVAPGFINVLSWAVESLIADGRGMSDTKQGVTLEIFGEGWSMGPLNARMKADALKQHRAPGVEQLEIEQAVALAVLLEAGPTVLGRLAHRASCRRRTGDGDIRGEDRRASRDDGARGGGDGRCGRGQGRNYEGHCAG